MKMYRCSPYVFSSAPDRLEIAASSASIAEAEVSVVGGEQYLKIAGGLYPLPVKGWHETPGDALYAAARELQTGGYAMLDKADEIREKARALIREKAGAA